MAHGKSKVDFLLLFRRGFPLPFPPDLPMFLLTLFRPRSEYIWPDNKWPWRKGREYLHKMRPNISYSHNYSIILKGSWRSPIDPDYNHCLKLRKMKLYQLMEDGPCWKSTPFFNDCSGGLLMVVFVSHGVEHRSQAAEHCKQNHSSGFPDWQMGWLGLSVGWFRWKI